MAVLITIESSVLQAEPGGTASGTARLRNDGPEAVSVDLDVDGDAAPWSWVDPPEASLAPGQEVNVRFGFRLPRASVPPAGPASWRLQARGRQPVAPTLAAAGGRLEVAPFSELSITVSPVREAPRGAARHQVWVLNRGNAPVPALLTASAPDDSTVVVVDPPTLIADPGRQAVAGITVTSRRRPFLGKERSQSFTVRARPEGSTAEATATATGTFRQEALVPLRAARILVGLVALALIGIAVRATVLEPSSSRSGTAGGNGRTSRTASGGAPTQPACPATGHQDTRANGLRPQDIPSLPATYSFSQVDPDGCTPVRWNPCDPIHFVINPTDAPPTGVADVREAFNRLSQATGVTFADDGATDETVDKGAARPDASARYEPERYGQRWAPILVAWTHGFGAVNGSIEVVGGGFPTRVGNSYVSGTLLLNVDAVTDPTTRKPLEGGFGPPADSGVGPVGPQGVTWGRVILHELSHVMGLGHSRDRSQLMYPEMTAQTTRPVKFGLSDLTGLRLLGRSAGCLAVPPLPAGQ